MVTQSPTNLLQSSSSLEEAVKTLTETTKTPNTKEYKIFAEALAKEDPMHRPPIDRDKENLLLDRLIQLDNQLLKSAPEAAQKVYMFSLRIFQLESQSLEKAAKDAGILSKYPYIEQALYALPKFVSWIFGIYVDAHSQRQSIVLQYLRLLPEGQRNFAAVGRGLRLASYIDVRQPGIYKTLLAKISASRNTIPILTKLEEILIQSEMTEDDKKAKTDLLHCLALLPVNQLEPTKIEETVALLKPYPGTEVEINQSLIREDMLEAMLFLPETDRIQENLENISTIFMHFESGIIRQGLLDLIQSKSPQERKDLIAKLSISEVIQALLKANNPANLAKVLSKLEKSHLSGSAERIGTLLNEIGDDDTQILLTDLKKLENPIDAEGKPTRKLPTEELEGASVALVIEKMSLETGQPRSSRMLEESMAPLRRDSLKGTVSNFLDAVLNRFPTEEEKLLFFVRLNLSNNQIVSGFTKLAGFYAETTNPQDQNAIIDAIKAAPQMVSIFASVKDRVRFVTLCKKVQQFQPKEPNESAVRTAANTLNNLPDSTSFDDWLKNPNLSSTRTSTRASSRSFHEQEADRSSKMPDIVSKYDAFLPSNQHTPANKEKLLQLATLDCNHGALLRLLGQMEPGPQQDLVSAILSCIPAGEIADPSDLKLLLTTLSSLPLPQIQELAQRMNDKDYRPVGMPRFALEKLKDLRRKSI